MPETEEIHITGGPRTRTNRKKPKPPPVNKTELKSGFYHGFRGFGLIIHSDEEIPEDEFNNMADAYESIAKRYPMLGYIVMLLAPFSVMGEFYDKALRIWESRKRFRKEKPNIVDAPSYSSSNADTDAA